MKYVAYAILGVFMGVAGLYVDDWSFWAILVTVNVIDYYGGGRRGR